MRKSFQGTGKLTAIALLCLGFVASRSEAQITSQIPSPVTSPSQLTPESLRPVLSSGGGVTLSGQSPQSAPPGSDQLNVLIGDVVLQGGFPELSVQTQTMIAQICGQRLTVTQIYAFATSLEQLYARAGFTLARIVVPPQRLLDRGKLSFLVVDGFIEVIDVAGLPEQVRPVIARRLAFLIGRRHVSIGEIERGLLMAGDVPGLKLRSTLARGQSDGGTRLVLEGQHRLITGSLGGDDRLGKTIGTWQLRGAGALNNALGAGEQVYATLGSVADLNAAVKGASPLTVFGGGVVIPIGNDGITLNPEYTRSTTQTRQAQDIPATHGTFERYAVRLRDPVIWTRNTSLNLNGSLEYIAQQLLAPAFGIALNRDLYGVVRLGADYAASLPWGTALQMGAAVSRGLGGRNEADALASNVPLSRSGASPDFAKLAGNVRVSQPLPAQFRLDVIGTGQTSFDRPLMRSEQISLDGSDAVSAYSSGTLSADQGLTVRGELSRPFAARFDQINASVSPYAFAAAARGWMFDITRVEQPIINAGALGIGVRSNLETANGSPGFGLGLELARQFTDVANLRQGWRFNISATATF